MDAIIKRLEALEARNAALEARCDTLAMQNAMLHDVLAEVAATVDEQLETETVEAFTSTMEDWDNV